MKGVEQPPQFHPEGDVFVHTRIMLGLLPAAVSVPLVLSVLFHDIGKPPTFSVDPDGRIVGRYRKIHLPGHSEHLPHAPFQHLEKRYFDVGNEGFKVWRSMGGNLGMCICNDRRWPETFRVMGLQGVEIVALGYNTPTENIHHPEPMHLRMFHHLVTMQANAYQNGTWVLAAAKAGKEDGFGLIGGSAIIAPTGEIAARALGEDDEVITATLDLDLGDYIKRTIFNCEKHRRIEHYRLITERTGVKTEV